MKKKISSILFLLFTSTLCMTYFTTNVVIFQLVVYAIILLCYFYAPKVPVRCNRNLYTLLCAFTLLYLIRAFVDLELLNERQELYSSNYAVYFFMLNGIVLPAFMIPRIRHSTSYFEPFVLLGLILTYSLYQSYSNFIQGNIFMTQDHRIMANENLGVIQFGHLGLTTVILGIYFMVRSRSNKFYMVLSVAMVSLGVMSMFLAGTRSAMLAAFIIAVIYLFAIRKVKTMLVIALVFIPFYVYSESIVSYFDDFGVNSANRIFRLLNEGGDQSSSRSIIWEKAFSDISDNLLFGVSSFFKMEDWTYVHNSIIEITYALGILGGCIFVYINFEAFKIGIRELRGNNVDNKFLVFLYIQYFIYSLFSESVLRLSLYWFFLAIVISFTTQKTQRMQCKPYQL